MDKTGLLYNIYEAVVRIDSGRKGFATRGKEQEGRINYETGIAQALSAFQEAQATADPQTIILAEYTFLTQELEFCEKTDKAAISSLSRAIRFFDWKARCIPRQYYKFPYQRRNRRFLHDAFLALEMVKDKTLYQCADKVIPHDSEYRIKSYPLDSFHVAIKGHKSRLQNILKTPGLDPIEKVLLKQRLDTLAAGQEGYVELQREALG